MLCCKYQQREAEREEGDQELGVAEDALSEYGVLDRAEDGGRAREDQQKQAKLAKPARNAQPQLLRRRL